MRMLLRLRCMIFGHQWRAIVSGVDQCNKCREARYLPERKPVSTLNEIIYDRDWYTAKKKK